MKNPLVRAKNWTKKRIYLFGKNKPRVSESRIWNTLIQNNWKDVESFDDAWNARIEEMARHIPVSAKVVDYGCGREWLKQIIGEERYTGVDYAQRSHDTVVCDFNNREFPKINCDVAFISGCLEFIEDVDWFVDNVTDSCHRCVISYCTLDANSDLLQRRRAGWVNDLTFNQLNSLFENNGFFNSVKEEINTTGSTNTIYVFDREQALNSA